MSLRDSPTPYSHTSLYSLISRQQNKTEQVSLHYRASSSFPYFYCVSSVSLSLSLSFPSHAFCISAESCLLSFASFKSLNHSHSVYASDCLNPELSSFPISASMRHTPTPLSISPLDPSGNSQTTC
ncbi:hypothetical protein E4T43_09388 [Aureobasidium subglaciale]|nr:hypothetical protein E4T43_09388 [Aureobasidium subglaciale]